MFVFLFIFGCVESSLLGGLFSTYGEWGATLAAECGLPIVVASLAVERRLQGEQASVAAVPRFRSTS